MSKPLIQYISICLMTCAAVHCHAVEYPSWWGRRGVIDASAEANDYAAANSGQVKWIAERARAELDENLPGGAGSEVEALLQSFTATNNYCGVNAGQLKNVAEPFYNRLIAEGVVSVYPWTGTTDDDNDFSLVNIGQVKNIFSFDLTFDADVDGLPDWWERNHFGDLAQDAQADFDNDGLNNLQELQSGSNPTLADSDDDGVGDADEVNVWFTNPRLADSDGDGLGDGQEVNDWNTDPLSADSDGDGATDGQEAMASLEDTRQRVLYYWPLVSAEPLVFAHEPGSPEDIADLNNALAEFDGVFYEEYEVPQ